MKHKQKNLTNPEQWLETLPDDIRQIVVDVAVYYNLTINDLYGRMNDDYPLFRYVVYTLARRIESVNYEKPKYTVSEIPNYFGQDHATCSYGIKTLESLMKTNPFYYKKFFNFIENYSVPGSRIKTPEEIMNETYPLFKQFNMLTLTRSEIYDIAIRYHNQ